MTNLGYPRVRWAKKAAAYLAEVDPVLNLLIEKYGQYLPSPPIHDGWSSLCRTILFQQLAGSAAQAIQTRWLNSYEKTMESGYPTPKQVLKSSDSLFRDAGISRQKISYLRSLAEHVSEGQIDFQTLQTLPDSEVIEKITGVYGLGEWSAHMFLMSQLRRPNILPVGDLGVRNGMQIAYQIRETVTPKKASEIGENWRPYCSAGAWYMWKVVDGDQDFFNLPIK